MRSPDDIAARKARLVREHCEAFMAGDDEAYAATAAGLRALLDAQAVAPQRQGARPGRTWRPQPRANKRAP